MNFDPLSLLFLLFPIAWFVFAKLVLKSKVTGRGVAIAFGLVLVIVLGMQYLSYRSQVMYTELLNSHLVKKYSKHVSCSHSYSCNCRTTTDNKGNSSTSCDTCYEHAYDVDWVLEDSLENHIEIARVDRQGLVEPPRFTSAKIGDPVAVEHHYPNYVKAVPDSLFNYSRGDYSKFTSLPAYPGDIYDYHYVDRVLAPDGVPLHDLRGWNLALANALSILGPSKQANVILVFTKNPDAEYAYAIRHKWNGGNKNDIIVVIGCPNYPNVAWAKVFCLTDKQMFQVSLEDDLVNNGPILLPNRDVFMTTLVKHVQQDFKRKRMHDFEYLKSRIRMSVQMMLLTVILSIIGTVIVTAVENNWPMPWDGFNRRRPPYYTKRRF